ncbi:MAG: leucyl aminopeptidase [Rhodoferax sp.]|uniref:leucyl aminopeptidase n=1 Tax=Rhodoferax sp. TaxID=50421 RepID=UPI0008CE64D0|nr:leucyl aminopeptidase [Rhodoferax sp.]MDP2678995.1 leucyl aminopeptidase [Rhodoferax sp.]OGB58832.1 MAG: leucyl aminopeptidase [Burkholderiales bacterium RIFOXYD12_FULL_59_19]OGB82536.1 MAG: leucyl aminopeptidase [Burkholderiales bacterium RIFOXYC12_FULL_60_6]
MNFELLDLDAAQAGHEKCDVLLMLLSSTFKAGRNPLSNLISKALKAGDLADKPGSLLDIYRPAGLSCARLVLVQVADGKPGNVRKGVSAAMALVKSAKPKQVTLCFDQTPDSQTLHVALSTLAEASYVYATTLSKAEVRTIGLVKVGVPSSTDLAASFDQTVATVRGIELAKEWANRPANHATPSHLAHAAQALAKSPRIKCTVMGLKEVEKLGMGAFLAVAKGSAEPLKFIELHYKGAAKNQPPVVLVGKGITFDSGGISIKPAAEMDEMKYDMCGAASVLGVFKALAELQPNINVVGLIPACENLPSSRAVKPGDVVTSMSGQTIEILNTDAEGRLVLCDALTYAERFKPQAVLDIATLTGACVIALGGVRSGFFSSDPALSAAMAKASESSQDLCWPMPLDDDYAEGLKTKYADVANVAGRPGGAITAAKFLQRFTSKYPWGHLDIAGSAWKSGAAKGATGRPVGLLLHYVMSLQVSAA